MNATVKAKAAEAHLRLRAAWRNLVKRLRGWAGRVNDRMDERRRQFSPR